MRDALQARGIQEVECRTGRSGQFDVVVDGKVAYSRDRTGRFPSDAEIAALVPRD